MRLQTAKDVIVKPSDFGITLHVSAHLQCYRLCLQHVLRLVKGFGVGERKKNQRTLENVSGCHTICIAEIYIFVGLSYFFKANHVLSSAFLFSFSILSFKFLPSPSIFSNSISSLCLTLALLSSLYPPSHSLFDGPSCLSHLRERDREIDRGQLVKQMSEAIREKNKAHRMSLEKVRKSEDNRKNELCIILKEKGLDHFVFSIIPSLQEHLAFVSLVAMVTTGNFISVPRWPTTSYTPEALAYTHTLKPDCPLDQLFSSKISLGQLPTQEAQNFITMFILSIFNLMCLLIVLFLCHENTEHHTFMSHITSNKIWVRQEVCRHDTNLKYELSALRLSTDN